MIVQTLAYNIVRLKNKHSTSLVEGKALGTHYYFGKFGVYLHTLAKLSVMCRRYSTLGI